MEDGSGMPLMGLFLLFLLLLLNGIFYGFSAAIKEISENEIEKQAADGKKRAILLLEILDKPVPYMNVIPIVVVTFGIFAGSFLVPELTRLFQPYIKSRLAFCLAVGVCVILFSSCGILTFRRLGTKQPERFAIRYVYIVHTFSTLLFPVTMLITWLARIFCVPFGISMDSIEDLVTEEEIISIVDEAHEQGVIEENEAEMIQNIISFNETDASDIMTHRMNVAAFAIEDTLHDIVNIMIEEGRSRYPVYGKDLDDIRGILHYKDVMEYVNRHPAHTGKQLINLPELLREAAFIPETRSIGDLFRAMQAKKIHMAVVVDEYGQTAGIISMQDILEEIVGEIQDEYDEEEILIRTQKDNTLIIHGLTSIHDIEEELKIDFGDLDFETLNGYFTSLLGHIPTEKDLGHEIVANGYRFTILSLGNKTIDRVRAEKINDKKIKGEEEICQDIQNLQT